MAGALLFLMFALSNSAAPLRGDATSFLPSVPSSEAWSPHSQNTCPVRSEQQQHQPVARLRGGKAAETLSADRIATGTQMKHREPFWVTGEDPPKRETVSEQGDMVMLQGFNWKSLADRKTLYRQLKQEMAPLASAGVKTVWFPPPSESADVAGYLPGRWYVIGNRTLLDDAVSAAKANGITPMVDVVLNHRAAVRISPNSSWWTEFEGPDWGEWAIVKDDWKCHPEEHLKVCPDNCTCGAADTGENACYAADIDHTNPRIQDDVIEWLRWLRTDLGFEAFRFDNTKGYAGNFTNLYIQATDPLYTVSEFYDSNRNLVSSWLNSSGRSSAVFDFGLRYKLKESVKHDDYSLLMDEWMGPMLWYDKELAVTFTDNHDTAGDHHFAISDHFGSTNQIAAGYAMILSHPSRPCIFWQDWMGNNRDTISKLLSIRQRAGVGPASEWRLVHGKKGLYAAFIGDKLAMKMGGDPWDPNARLPTAEWKLSASGDVKDKEVLPPVEPRVVPKGQRLLLDASFDCEGHDGNMIKARVSAFCPAQGAGAGGATNVTVRVFAADEQWPWPANNDTNKFKVRQGLVMHWAAGTDSSADWGRPSDDMAAAPTSMGYKSWREGDAVQTAFFPASSGAGESEGWERLAPHVHEVRLQVPGAVRALNFVLKHPTQYHDGEDKWYKADGDFHRPPSDFHIRLPKAGEGTNYWAVWEKIELKEAA